MHCPHCEKPIPAPPKDWAWTPPWQCSHCDGLFGVSIQGEAFRIPGGMKPLHPLFTWYEARQFGFLADTKSYVYAICYPSGLPFYVGRGMRYRVCQHIEEVGRLVEDDWTEKHHLLNDLMARNESEWYHFLALVETKEEAGAIEQANIQRWGLRQSGGMLTNRARPMSYPYLEALPEVQFEPRMIVNQSGPRPVHHPDHELSRFSGGVLEFNCPICRKACTVANELAAKVCQCPHCAHFTIPLNPHHEQPGPWLFKHLQAAEALQD